MKRFTMLRSYLLRFQLQMLGIFHWAPIHWRHRCLLCTDEMWGSKADKLRHHDHDKSMPCNDLFQTEEHIVNDHEARFDDPRDEDFAEDMDESAGLLSPTNYMGEHSEIWWEDDTGDGEICVVCASLRWNREGDVVRNIEEWVPRPFRRSVGTIVSMLFMVVLTFGMCYNTVLYFRYLFGREDEVMHLTSFMSFSISLSSVTLICVYAKTRYYLSGYGRNLDTEGGRSRDWGWCEVLHQDYMTRRLQYLCGASGFRLPSLSFHMSCLLWPAVNVIFEIVYMYFNSVAQVQPVNLMFAVIEVLSVTHGMLLFGVFCYTLFLLRSSFETECNLLLAFFVENEGHLDRCRLRLAETYRDYRVFRSAVSAWVAFIVTIGILGLTIHLSWNYDVYSGNEKLEMSGKDLILLNCLIFSEKLMILTLPVFAVGGMDHDCLWRHFRLALSRNRRSEQEYFWERLTYYLRELTENDRETGITMFLSVVSLYTGLRLGVQNLDYSRLPVH